MQLIMKPVPEKLSALRPSLLFCLCAALVLVMLLGAPGVVRAEGVITVQETNLVVMESGGYGCFFAEVENTGDAPMGVGNGTLVVYTPDGGILLAENYISTTPANLLLQPGERAYMRYYIWNEALTQAQVGNYQFAVGKADWTSEAEQLACEAELKLAGVGGYENYVYVTYTNTGDEVQYNHCINVVLWDEAGELVYADSYSTGRVGVHPGSTVTVSVYLDGNLLDGLAQQNRTPVTAAAQVLWTGQ